MAKKRSKKKSSGGGRRRVGKIPGGDGVQMIVGALGGAILTKLANKSLSTKLDPKILAGIELVAGGALAVKSRNPLLKGVGIGMASGAGGALLGAFVPALAGMSGTESIYMTTAPRYLNGAGAGFPKINTVGASVPGSFPRPNAVGGGRGVGHVIGGVFS